MASRRYGTVVGHLKNIPEAATELASKLDGETLHHLAEAVADEQRSRASPQAIMMRRDGGQRKVEPQVEGSKLVETCTRMGKRSRPSRQF